MTFVDKIIVLEELLSFMGWKDVTSFFTKAKVWLSISFIEFETKPVDVLSFLKIDRIKWFKEHLKNQETKVALQITNRWGHLAWVYYQASRPGRAPIEGVCCQITPA